MSLLAALYLIEILHQTTTESIVVAIQFRLYLIEILHQTTTYRRFRNQTVSLYLIEILHQTTTTSVHGTLSNSCILSKFYIKPQRPRSLLVMPHVVSYRNSTSNHNYAGTTKSSRRVVSYRNSTSNHNWKTLLSTFPVLYLIEILHQTTTCPVARKSGYGVVSYRNSTSNHNSTTASQLRSNVVSYRNSTSNHNAATDPTAIAQLYLIEILHQTTTIPRTKSKRRLLYLIEILHQTTTRMLFP